MLGQGGLREDENREKEARGLDHRMKKPQKTNTVDKTHIDPICVFDGPICAKSKQLKKRGEVFLWAQSLSLDSVFSNGATSAERIWTGPRFSQVLPFGTSATGKAQSERTMPRSAEINPAARDIASSLA
jgi:hypothetical protein